MKPGATLLIYKTRILITLAILLSYDEVLAYDIDVTFIDRLPNYAYDAPKNKPWDGDAVTFVGHIKLDHSDPIDVPYVWYLDGIELSSGTTELLPETDNTISVPWTWDSERHEVMLSVGLAQAHTEDSGQNNILFDFTDALIVGIAVENGLVEAFPAFQQPLGIGSQGFEDWYQRMIRIWNLMFMEPASNLSSNETINIRDRVRGVLSYHPDGTLTDGNCPLQWKEVDMLWGKLAADTTWYHGQKPFWFFEWALPHELTHARYLPDTYTFDLGGSVVEVIDDSGLKLIDTPYMPQSQSGGVRNNQGANGIMGAGGLKYGLFSGYMFNRVAGQRDLGCNTNGCCSHNSDWPSELPASIQFQILDLNNEPWVGARLDIYTRVGTYPPIVIDNEIDFSMETDAHGRASLPLEAFSDIGMFILKIVSPDESKREYRFIDRTNFHIAFWSGATDSYDHVIRTEFDPWPTTNNILNRSAARGETFEMTFQGTGFKQAQSFIYGDPAASIGDITWVNENEVRVTMKHPESMFQGQKYRLFNPDGKYAKMLDDYQQAVNLEFPDARPFARFLFYPTDNNDYLDMYFNGLWSDDWSRLYQNNGQFPVEGTGPISSYSWDFGDGSLSSAPFVVHSFPRPGKYKVSLTVSDSDGYTDTITKTVYVKPLFADGFERTDFPVSEPIFMPIFIASIPASPADDNSPAIIGAAEKGTIVNLYSDNACSDLLATGTSDEFNTFGITINVADDSVTTVYATATNGSGAVSPCSTSFITYIERDCDIIGTWAEEARDCTVDDCETFDGGRYRSWDGKTWCRALQVQEGQGWNINVPEGTSSFDFWADWGAWDLNDCDDGVATLNLPACSLDIQLSRGGEEQHFTCDITGESSVEINQVAVGICDYVIIGDPHFY